MHNMGEYYGIIVENINDLVSVVNLDLEFEYINEITHKNLIGYSSVELLGKKVSSFIHTDDRENFLSIFNNSIDIGIKFVEARIRHHDGHYLWIETNSKPFKDKHGKLKVIAISRVITERKNAEEKIKLKSRQWKTTFDALKEPIFILDLNQKIIQCNQATLKMFKKSSPDEIIGQSCYELVHCRSQPVDWCPVMRMIKTNRRESSFNQIDDKLVEVSADPIYDENNRLIGAVHLITDVTLKQLTEQKLKESEDKYHSLFESFPHFIGIIDMKGILIDCNSAINKFISMHKKEDFIGLSFIQILSIIDKNQQLIPKLKKLMNETISDGKLKALEFKMQRSKGDYLWLRVEGSSIQINNEPFIQFIIQDITERKFTDEKLKNSEFTLKERVKELSCIYKLSKLIENKNLNDASLFYGIIDLIPPAFQFTKSVCTRIFFDNNIYSSFDLEVTDWKLSTNETINNKELKLEVFYLEEKPFSKEEHDLIGEIVIRLKSYLEERDVQRKLRDSEEKYRLITESANDMISVLNKSIKYEYINETAFLNILGRTKDELIGKRPLKWAHPEDIEYCIKAFKDGFEKGVANLQARFRNKNGQYLWLDIKGKTFIDVDGEKKALVISRDITDQKNSEEKLRQSEERYRLISQNAEENLFIFDMNLNLIYNDTSVPNILGYSYEEMRTLKLTDYNVSSSLKIAFDAYKEELRYERKKLKDPKRIRTFEGEQIHKDGSIINVETRFTFLRDKNGKATSILGLSKNITKRKQAEQKLRESEERYRLISQNADENLFIFDMNLNVIYHDPNVPNILGYTNDEISELKLTDYNEPSSLNTMLKAYREEIRNERKKLKDPMRIRSFEIDQIHKNGSIVNVEVKFTFLRDEKGIAKGIISMTRDISKRKQAEQKVRESEEKYRLISETAYDLIGILNKRFKYEYINEHAFQQILGYSSKELLGKSSLKFIHPDDAMGVAKVLFEGFKEGEGVAECRFRHKDGHWVWIEARGKTFQDRDGNLKAIVISRDTTERRLAEEKLKKSEIKYRDAYDRATFYKDLFTHDMNNILAVINSSAEIIPYYIRGSEKAEDIEKITSIVQKQVDRGVKLINNVSTLSILEEGVVEIEPTNVNDLLENSIDFMQKSYQSRNLNIELNTTDDTFHVQANSLLREVFDNILINGVKYNSYSNPSIDIFITISREIIDDSKFIKMQFIDNGIGVPDDRKDLIFQRGNRELKGSKGMGIGLSLVKRILKNYNGKIWVENRIKDDYTKGSNFNLLIPEAI